MRDFLKKEFLLGLGTGFIISALILSVYGTNISATGTNTAKPLPQSQIKKETDLYKDTKTSYQSTRLQSTKSQLTKSQSNKPNPAPKYITVSVSPGMSSERISSLLEEKGVISDSQAFYKVITAHHAHSKFKVGTWNLPAGGDMEEILRIMTGR